MKHFSILILSYLFSLTAFGQQNYTAKKDNTDSLINFYQSETSTYFQNDTLISNEKTAVAVAEAILFNSYGKGQIESEKPYGVKYKNGCWYINGSLPPSGISIDKNGDTTYHIVYGGVFSIVINAKDGKTVVFPHGK